MATTIEPRREYGVGHLGGVFIHHFESEDGDRNEVRAGNHTVSINDTLEAAEVVAHSLVGSTPQPKPSETLSKAPKGVNPAPKVARR